MLTAIRNSMSDLASSKDEEDGEDKDDDKEDTGHGNLSEDDEPGWVMGTISKMVPHRMESFHQKQLRLDELTQPGWGDAADYFRKRDMKYGTTKLKIPGCWEAPRSLDCSHTITDNIWRAYAGS
jgi:hypothetical protein